MYPPPIITMVGEERKINKTQYYVLFQETFPFLFPVLYIDTYVYSTFGFQRRNLIYISIVCIHT